MFEANDKQCCVLRNEGWLLATQTTRHETMRSMHGCNP